MEGLPGGTTLKGRKNVILTNRSDYRYSDGVIVHSVEEALEELRRFPEEQIYIIGGEQIYRQFLPYCDKAYITKMIMLMRRIHISRIWMRTRSGR